MPLPYFSCLIVIVRIFSKMVNECGKGGEPFFILKVEQKFSFFHLYVLIT